MVYKKTKLKNGLRVISVPMKNAQSVTVLVLVGTGSKYETKDINGISHFLEHMFFKGTKKRPNTLAISETLDRIGGQYNAFTSKEVTGFWAKVDKKHTDIALDWISDMFEDLLYGDQPAGWRIVGEKETIINYNREKLLDYYHSHYSNLNTVVCVAGDIDSKKIEEKVKNYFANIEIRKHLEKPATKEKQSKPDVLIHHKRTDQTHF